MKRVTLPALSHRLRRIMQLLVILGSIGFVPILAHATSASLGANTTSLNVLLNYGNGTLIWYNQTLVPSTWNVFNVTELITKGNLGSVFFASFGSHFVYSINGVGCPSSNIFCDEAWGFWTLDGIFWDLPFVGVDMIPVSQSTTVAWYLNPAAAFSETPPRGVDCSNLHLNVQPDA